MNDDQNCRARAKAQRDAAQDSKADGVRGSVEQSRAVTAENSQTASAPVGGQPGVPDGWKLGEGWRADVNAPWTCSMSYCQTRSARYRSATHGACWVHAKEMGAIVPAEPSRPVTGEAALGYPVGTRVILHKGTRDEASARKLYGDVTLRTADELLSGQAGTQTACETALYGKPGDMCYHQCAGPGLVNPELPKCWEHRRRDYIAARTEAHADGAWAATSDADKKEIGESFERFLDMPLPITPPAPGNHPVTPESSAPACVVCGEDDIDTYVVSNGRRYCEACRCKRCGGSPPDGNTCLCDYTPKKAPGKPDEAPLSLAERIYRFDDAVKALAAKYGFGEMQKIGDQVAVLETKLADAKAELAAARACSNAFEFDVDRLTSQLATRDARIAGLEASYAAEGAPAPTGKA